MGEHLEKALADATLRRKKITRSFTSSGIRELDEMLGGGFLPGTQNLIQQDLGSGGEIILSRIIELELSLSNIVLLILTDPTAAFLEGLINKLDTENLLVLNLVAESRKNSDVIFDKHEISLKIRHIRKKATELLIKKREEFGDDDIQLFTFLVSLNPFVLNLSDDKVTMILYDNLLQCIDQNSIDIILLNKAILSAEMNARIQSLCHGVIDLRSYFEGVQKKNEIRILKMIGRYYDVKIEPYVIAFDETRNKYDFIIKSAFLTSFETFRNLLTWNKGSIALSKVPYVMAPVSYLNALLEMPYNVNPKKGKDEIIEKARGIGRRLAIMVEKLYFVENIALFKSTLQTASLLGWGNAKIEIIELEEHLLELTHIVHKKFNQEVYEIFLDGYYRGMIKRTLNRGIRYIKIFIDDEQNNESSNGNTMTYRIRIRLVRYQDDNEF
ncbi:MAG: hypothetical protein GF364_18930 [Candidatus Lokiarchaeota archaeon]|nr:hypothetical protein [Candidatus Lokiarchaeota archaeon]